MAGFVGSLAVALVVAAGTVQGAPDAPGATTALVQELRALREAVESVLATNVRVQLLMGRLQLQEARIQALVRQSAEIDSQLAGMASERQAISEQVRVMEHASNEARINADERDQAKQMLAGLSERLKELETRHASLLADQASVQQLVLTEQNRWGEFNQRLEELERVLATPRR
jgi:chromosome segregation ATPase